MNSRCRSLNKVRTVVLRETRNIGNLSRGVSSRVRFVRAAIGGLAQNSA